MDEDWKLKAQAWLDGELPAQEAQRVQDRVGKDAEAQALLKELEGANTFLDAFERELRVPESREFYWSRIQRAIHAGEPVAPATTLWLTRWWKLVLPVAATTALVLVFALSRSGPGHPSRPAAQSTLAAQAQPAQCTIADPAALTYEDYNAGATLVWFSYPPEKELAANR